MPAFQSQDESLQRSSSNQRIARVPHKSHTGGELVRLIGGHQTAHGTRNDFIRHKGIAGRIVLQPTQSQFRMRSDPRLVSQPNHERNARIVGVLSMLHEILQERQCVLLLESLSGRRQLQPDFRRFLLGCKMD